MKLHLLIVFAVLSQQGIAFAQQSAPSFDSERGKTNLAKPVTKNAGRFIPKGGEDLVIKRFYAKDAVVITRQSGATETHPFVEVPLLFRVNTDELLDDTSRVNVAKVAAMLKEIGGANATFAIEGHASAEGEPQRNRELSNLRALRIQSLLREQGIGSGLIARTEGFGSDHAQFKNPNASAAQLQQDRRVLVVRER